MSIVTAVLNAHHEGMLAGMSIASFIEAIDEAEQVGIEIDPIIVLDRPNQLTRDIFAANPVAGARLVVTDFGDPAHARQLATEMGRGKYVTFLDADDLWSFNWLTACTEMCENASAPFVVQSELNWVYGDVHNFWIHADSTAPGFDPTYMALNNYWDSMIFTWRDLILTYPFRANDLKAGFGHEDWYWHTVLMLDGIEHRPALGTMHMKRRRPGSQLALCAESDVVPWQTSVYRLSREWNLARAML